MLPEGFSVSRETEAKLYLYANLLTKWQKSQNLIANSTLNDIWNRHFADSLQLISYGLAHCPWIDIGSGAGFPGLVIAITNADAESHVYLVESNQSKCAFLREVIRETQASATVIPKRVDEAINELPTGIKTLTARALAPLDRLCRYIQPLLTNESVALFLKGRNLEEEIQQALQNWTMNYEIFPSKTNVGGKIIRISDLQKKSI